MKIAVLGTGRVGGTLGTRWAQAGRQVVFGSRNPNSERAQELIDTGGGETHAATYATAAEQGDIIVLAIPWSEAESILGSLGDLSGKVIVDCINPINQSFTGLDLECSESGSEKVATWAGDGAKVVKAFNTASSRTMADPMIDDQRSALFFCGDDDDAKQTVATLIELLGFDPVDSGPLQNARYLEPAAMLLIQVSMKQRKNLAFQVLEV